MPRAHPIDPDVRRAQLVAAARGVFAQKGYYAAGVSDIIEAAGVARGTFYNYFDSKRQIFQAVLEELMTRAGAAVEDIDVRAPIPPQIYANMVRVVRLLQEMGDESRILFQDAASIDAEGAEALSAFYAEATERIQRALRTGQEMGIVRECDVALTASCLLGMLKEPVFEALLLRRPFEPERLVQTILGIVSVGLMRG